MERKPGQKDWLIAMLLSTFLGFVGADRFYLGYIGTGVAKLLTIGGFGIWAIIDSVLIIGNKIPDSNGVLPYKKEPLAELIESGQVSKKEWIVALLYSIFYGWLGIDRFYIGHKKLGMLKLGVFILIIITTTAGLIYGFTALNEGMDPYGNVKAAVFAIINLLILIELFAAFVWWVVDIVLIALNKLTDNQGRLLWK